MKRLVIILAAVLAGFTASAGTVTKNFDNLKKFTGIQISNSFDATLIQSDDWSARVTIDTDYEEYLDVSVVGNILYVRLKDMPRRLKDLTRKTMKVTICTPSLNQIHLTGAVRLQSNDKWESPMEKFTLDLSGAAKAEKLYISGMELKADISGASNGTVMGDFAELDVDISGASAIFFNGNFSEIDVDASGTSKVSIMGTADSIESECSGTSLLDAAQLSVDSADIACSGASKATIDVNKRLEVNLTGASTCHYSSKNPSLEVVPSVSRASSFKKVN